MTLDLSYIHEQPSEAQEEAIKKAVEQECIRAITQFLDELAETMLSNNIAPLSPDALQAMSAEMKTRLETNDNTHNDN